MTATPPAPAPAFFWRPRGFFLLLTGYVLLHWLMRPWLTATAGSGDVDQIFFSQALELGYSVRQQPLYSWLMWAVVQVMGPSNAAAALLKYGLVFLIHGFVYLGARRLLDDPRLAFLAAFSPLLIYALGWRVHEADSHGVVAGALVAAATYLVLRLATAPKLKDFLLLGLAAGLGLLASAMVPFALAGLGLAAAVHPGWRAALMDRRMALAVVVAAALVLPHALWLAEHWERVVLVFDQSMRGASLEPHLGRAAAGLGNLALAVVLSQFPFWVIFALLFPRALARLPAGRDGPAPAARVLSAAYLATLALLALFLVLLGVPRVTPFDLYPLLITLPLYAFWRAERAGIEARRVRWMAIALAVVFVVVVQARVQQIIIGPAFCKVCRLQAPYPEVARAIAAAGYRGGGTIVADDQYLAGNFRLQFPAARVLTSRYPLFLPGAPETPGQCLVLWHAEQVPELSSRLELLAAQSLGLDLAAAGAPRYIEAMVPHSDTAIAAKRVIRIGYLMPAASRGRGR